TFKSAAFATGTVVNANAIAAAVVLKNFRIFILLSVLFSSKVTTILRTQLCLKFDFSSAWSIRLRQTIAKLHYGKSTQTFKDCKDTF
ncbi:MAG: hypothetical protein K0U57_11785, partial [Alphaproteobacteria bacterium]|nr:hypothetical protein [Alphaproteobacteria bacterium]